MLDNRGATLMKIGLPRTKDARRTSGMRSSMLGKSVSGRPAEMTAGGS